MSRPFAITAASNSVFLDKDRQGETSFTVSNQSGRAITGQARLVADDTEAENWIKLRGQAHRDFAIAGTEQYVAEIDVPPDAPGGHYTLRLDMVGEERPDEQYVEGPAVTFQVPDPEPEPETQAFPWKIVAAIAAVLLIGGGVLAAHTFDIWPFGSSHSVTGTVTDVDTGESLAGVAVRVAETTIDTTANVDGTYSLDMDGSEETLLFTLHGYQEEGVEIGEREVIDVELSKESGSIIAWGGSDTYGEVSNTPSGSDFVTVAASSQHGLALRNNGTIEAWGRDHNGSISDTPIGTGFVAVATGVTLGVTHSLALRDDGTIEAWGRDNGGSVSNTPDGNDFVAVAAGAFHSLALRNDGTIEAWGRDNGGSVGDTPDGNDFVAVAAGALHSLALRDDGTIEAWGQNSGGSVSDTPTGTGFMAVAAGLGHNLALRENGTIEAWGLDEQLFGSEQTGQVSETPSESGFVDVAAGGAHSLALREDGTIEAWGLDHLGQVSDTPSGRGFIALTAGGHNLALGEF